jgi:hypothetical protein
MSLLLGSFISFTTTGRLTARLVIGGAVAWSFLPVLQVCWVAIAGAVLARRRLGLARAVDLYCAGHGPWSLCFLAFSALTILVPPERYYRWPFSPEWLLLCGLPLVMGWSAVITGGFLRGAFETTAAGARFGVLLHTAVVYGPVVAHYALSGQLWPRLVGLWS